MCWEKQTNSKYLHFYKNYSIFVKSKNVCTVLWVIHMCILFNIAWHKTSCGNNWCKLNSFLFVFNTKFCYFYLFIFVCKDQSVEFLLHWKNEEKIYTFGYQIFYKYKTKGNNSLPFSEIRILPILNRIVLWRTGELELETNQKPRF